MENFERIEEIKGLVKEKEEGIIQEYISLGKLYFNIHKDDEMQMFKDVTDILKLQAEIRELEEELAVLTANGEASDYVASKERVAVADMYQEDSTVSKTEFLYNEIIGKQKEEAVLAEEADSSAAQIAESVEEAEENTEFEEAAEEAEETADEPEVTSEETEAAFVETEATSEEAAITTEETEVTNEEAAVEAEETTGEATGETEATASESDEEEGVLKTFGGFETEETAAATEEKEIEADNKTEVNNQADSFFDNEKTCMITDNFMGVEETQNQGVYSGHVTNAASDTYQQPMNQSPFGSNQSAAQMPYGSQQSAPQSPYGSQPAANQIAFGNQHTMNSQPYGNQPVMNQNPYGNPYGMNQNSYNNQGFRQNGFMTNYQDNHQQSAGAQPFGNYGYQQTTVQAPVSPKAVDSAIDNEATMILDSSANMKPSMQQQPQRMQSQGSFLKCRNCGKDAPDANFCIFCGSRLK